MGGLGGRDLVGEMGLGAQGRSKVYLMVLPHLQSSFGFLTADAMMQCDQLPHTPTAKPSLPAFLATPSPPHLPQGNVDCPVRLQPRIKPSSLNRLLARHLVTAMSGYCTLHTRSQRSCRPCRFRRQDCRCCSWFP